MSISQTSPFRIVHLNSMLTGGGTDDQCVKLAAGLLRMGQKVWIAGPSGRYFGPMIEASGVPFFDTGATRSKIRFVLNSAKLIRRERIEIVHGHHGRDIWPTIFAARLSGVAPTLVLSRHLAKSPGSWASRQFLLRQCDAFVAVSKFVAKVLREGDYEPQSPEAERHSRPPMRGDFSKIRVIYGGIDTDKFRPASAEAMRQELGLAPGNFGFAVAGGYDLPRGKGQREFLKAAAQIHQQAPNARFLIIGRGSMAEILTADIEKLGLTGKAWLAGQKRDMPQVMNAIDCLVHPQIGTEALGLVVCEAHACGKPVIASALDGIPEAFAVGGFGELVPQEDVSALAQAMLRQSQKPPPSSEFAQTMHAKVEKAFSLERQARDMLELYQSLRRR